jgi:hypothetical protein
MCAEVDPRVRNNKLNAQCLADSLPIMHRVQKRDIQHNNGVAIKVVGSSKYYE